MKADTVFYRPCSVHSPPQTQTRVVPVVVAVLVVLGVMMVSGLVPAPGCNYKISLYDLCAVLWLQAMWLLSAGYMVAFGLKHTS